MRSGPRLPVFTPDTARARDFLIYEDASLLAFNKPAGLSVQGGSGVEAHLDAMLAAFARAPGKRQPRLAHRLDRETSGVIVAGRTHPSLVFLNTAFADRTSEKTYLALVCGGAPVPADGVIDLALVKEKARGVDLVRAARSGEHGQDAQTLYRTLAATNAAALVEARPRTGRMHQIRKHLESLGRPIAGDGKYGGLFSIGSVATPHLLLHAQALDLPHPEGGRIRFRTPAPPAFCETAHALGLFSDALDATPLARRYDPAKESP